MTPEQVMTVNAGLMALIFLTSLIPPRKPRKRQRR
jgi:hypothetical protein